MRLAVIVHAKSRPPVDILIASDGRVIVPKDPWMSDLRHQVTHRVVITPEVKLCLNFRDLVWSVMLLRPNDPICLLPCGDFSREAIRRGVTWCSSMDGLYTDAVLLPQGIIDTWSAWKKWATDRYVQDEDAMVAYLWSYGKRILHPVPSLAAYRTDENAQMAAPDSTWKDEEPLVCNKHLRQVGPDVLLNGMLRDELKSSYDYDNRRWISEDAKNFAPPT